jgi:hypothetical protein
MKVNEIIVAAAVLVCILMLMTVRNTKKEIRAVKVEILNLISTEQERIMSWYPVKSVIPFPGKGTYTVRQYSSDGDIRDLALVGEMEIEIESKKVWDGFVFGVCRPAAIPDELVLFEVENENTDK